MTREKLFGPAKTPLQMVVFVTMALMLLSTGILAGGMYFYELGTGTSLFTQGKDAVLPPEQATDVSYQEVKEFVEDAETDLDKYSQGYNCVESALLLARSAAWEGLPVEVVKVEFSGGEPSHLLLVFPTTDNGWVYIDPLTEAKVDPHIGGSLAGGSRISMLYYLRIGWIPFEEETK